MIILVAIIVSVLAAAIAGVIAYSLATEHSRKKYTDLVEQHYIQEHLEPDELTIVRVGESSISQPLADGLMSYGAEITSSAGLDIPGDMPSKDTIYIIEEDLIRVGTQNAEFQSFLRNATSNHSLIVVVGDDSDNPASALNQALDQAGVEHHGAVGNGGGPLVSFKISEVGTTMNTSYGPNDDSQVYWEDVALSIVKTAREETDHTQLFQ